MDRKAWSRPAARPARGRNQPLACQGSGGAARSDGGAAGHRRRKDAQTAGAVPRHGDPESDRAGGPIRFPKRRRTGSWLVQVGYPDEQSEAAIVRLNRAEEGGAKAVVDVSRRQARAAVDLRCAQADQVSTCRPQSSNTSLRLCSPTCYPDRYDAELAKWIQVARAPGRDRPRQGSRATPGCRTT